MRIAEVLAPAAGGTFKVKKRIGSYPRVRVEGSGRGVVSQAGAVLLVETARKTGLDAAISAVLEPWRQARAVHDPGKARLWDPRRLRLLSTAAQLITTGRRRYLRLAKHWPWTHVITEALERLHALPNPG